MPLNKMLKLHNLTDFRSVLQESNRYYLQAFLDQCLYQFDDKIDV